jgi:hypothetical protein
MKECMKKIFSVWFMYDECMRSVWFMYGLCMDSVWIVYG